MEFLLHGLIRIDSFDHFTCRRLRANAMISP